MISLSATGSFYDQFRQVCLAESAIAPSVFEANVIELDPLGVHEALGWKISRQRGFGKICRWSEAIGFSGEDGEIWQVKIDVPEVDRNGKVIKYLSPKGKGARVYLPAVPEDIRRLMSVRFGVVVPIEGDFWEWFGSCPEARTIPVVLTEGGKKALCLVSLGIPAISLYGCSSAWEKRESVMDPRVLLPQIRNIVIDRPSAIAFDQDQKLQTRAKVRAAICVLAKKLDILSPVRVIEWDGSQGKGVDDFVAAQGAEAFWAAFSDALPWKEWRKTNTANWAQTTLDQFGGRAMARLSFDAARVSDGNLALPELGQALLIDSPMGSGKTHWYGLAIAQLREIYGEIVIDAIGHRNNLLSQTARRLNLAHIHDLKLGRHTQLAIGQSRELAYCVDSLWRRFDDLVRAIEAGQKVLLILDEVDALIRHLLTASTIKPARRIELIRKFAQLLRQIAAGNGWIIGGEAQLSQTAVDALQALSGDSLKIAVARNDRQPTPWQVAIAGTEGKTQTAALAKQQALSITWDLAARGKRVLLLTTARQAAQELDAVLTSLHGVETLRIDGDTSSEDWCKKIFANPGQELREHRAQVVIATPSIESGVSIDGEGIFEAVVLHAGGLEPSSSYQLLGRVRDASVPRFVCAAAFTQGSTGNSFDPTETIRKWEDRAQRALSELGLEVEADPSIDVAKDFAARYLARETAGGAILQHALITKLQAEGHQLTSLDVALDQEKADLKKAKEALADQRVADWLAADDSAMTPEQARELVRDSELSHADRVKCSKAIARGKYGDVVDQEDWARKYRAEEIEGRQAERSVSSAADYELEGVAIEADRRELRRQIRKGKAVWTPGFTSRSAIVQILHTLQVHHVLSLPEGEWFTKDHWAVKAVWREGCRHREQVKEILGLEANPDKSDPIGFLKSVLVKRLGFETDSKRVREIHKKHIKDHLCEFSGSDSSPSTKVGRAYRLTPHPYRQQMIEAIAQYEAALQQQEAEAQREHDLIEVTLAHQQQQQRDEKQVIFDAVVFGSADPVKPLRDEGFGDDSASTKALLSDAGLSPDSDSSDPPQFDGSDWGESDGDEVTFFAAYEPPDPDPAIAAA